MVNCRRQGGVGLVAEKADAGAEGALGEWSTPGVHVLCMLATVGASVLCYRWIERPWRQRLRGASAPIAPIASTTSPPGGRATLAEG
jgi:peptidoglycan/LPS O-acetylase OafA/YrhL